MKAVRFFHKGTTMFSGSNIAASFKLFQYAAGTTTKTNTYTSAAKTTPNANPMTLNADGRLDQDVYIDSSMKFVLASSTAGDPPSSSVWTIDNALANEQVWQTATKTANYTVVEADRDKLFLVDATSGSLTVALLAAATAGDGFQIAVKKTDSSINTVTIDANGTETIDGNLTLTLSNQNEVAILTSNGTQWYVINSAAAQSTTFVANDATNNNVTNLATFQHTTSGAPAAGIGAGILFNSESADETPSAFGRLAFVADDVTAGSEDTYLEVQSRRAGAALATTYEFKSTGTAQHVFTGAPSLERTITLPDADMAHTHSGGKLTYTGTLTADRVVTVPDASFTLMQPASAAEMETATNLTAAVTPGRTQFHPGVAKAWAYITVAGGTPTLVTSHNIASITDTSAGNITINLTTAFSSANYVAVANAMSSSGDAVSANVKIGQTASSFIVRTFNTSTGTDTDNISFSVIVYGDQ